MSFKQFLLVLFNVSILLMSGKVLALELFVSAGISRIDLEIAGVGFDPKLARGSVGLFFWDGIALEVQGDFSNEEDELPDIGVSADIPKFEAAYVRLQSAETEGYSAYVNLGYAKMTLLTFPTLQPLNYVEEELTSPIFVIGFQKPLDRLPSLAYALSYERMYEDDRVDMSAITFEYSYKFGIKK